MADGIYTLDELQAAIARAPERWRPLVLTNGCFDLLHVGHVRYLQAARTLGAALAVGVNADSSVAQLKPPQPGRPPRPLVPEAQRAEVVAALGCVDATFVFPELTAAAAIAALAPDIYVKGGDYTVEQLPETPAVRAVGGRIELIAIEIPTSTTAIVERVAAALSG